MIIPDSFCCYHYLHSYAGPSLKHNTFRCIINVLFCRLGVMLLQLLLIVLNKVEKLDELLETFLDKGFSGATIINSTGMISKLAKTMEDYPIFGSLRYLIDLDREENKTIFMALKDE